MRSDVKRVIIPNQRTTSRWPNSYSGAIDDELVSRVGCEVEERSGWLRWETKLATECDDACGGVFFGRIDPIGNPNPIGLELIDDLWSELV
jgi:hypothetical protein